MTSLLDLEDDPNRTDYFGNVMTDAIEPSSSPSDGGFPYRTLIEEQIRRAADLGSPASAANHRYRDHTYHTEEDDMASKKQARAFARESREVRKMGTLLLLTTERLDAETKKANEAERKVQEMIALVRSTVEAKMMAQQDAARVNEELRLYKLQYENAQREIFKAQEVINRIESQRLEAEEAAARARSTARKLKEQNLVMVAKEEGRALGFQEGLARGRKLGYDEAMFRYSTPVQEDYIVRSEAQSEDEDYTLAEQPSSIRMRSPTMSVPIREQEQPESHISRPASGSARRHHDTASRLSVSPVTTQINAPSTGHTTQQPPSPSTLSPTPILAPSLSRKRNRSDSVPYSLSSRRNASPIPPDNWIPIADENNYISMPPPHTMAPSPTISPQYPSQSLPKSAPTPTPEQREPNTPAASSVRIIDYTYAESSRRRPSESRESLQVPLRASTPGSQTSTHMSDYGLLTSPIKNNSLPGSGPPPPLPVFRDVPTEPSSPDDKVLWKYDSGSRSSRSKRRPPLPREPTPRVNGGPRPRPESITKPPIPMIAPPPPVSEERPTKGPKRSLTSSSSSSSATSSSTSDRVKNDPRKDSNGARTPLGWIKKKIRDRFSEASADGGVPVPDITIQSPSNSSASNPETDVSTIAQPELLSPAYHETPLPSLTQPPLPQRSKTPVAGERQRCSNQEEHQTQRSQLPPLAELGNLISPDPSAIGDLPPGFVPFMPPVRAPSRAAGSGSERSGSARSVKGKGKGAGVEEWYEVAPVPPGVLYPQLPPFLPPSREMTKSRAGSRGSGSDRGGMDAPPRVFRV